VHTYQLDITVTYDMLCFHIVPHSHFQKSRVHCCQSSKAKQAHNWCQTLKLKHNA